MQEQNGDLCLRTDGRGMTVTWKNPTCRWYNGSTTRTFDECIPTNNEWNLERDGQSATGLIRGEGPVPYAGPGTYKISGEARFHANGGPGGGSGDIANDFSDTRTFTSDRDSAAPLVPATATLAQVEDSRLLGATLTLTNKGTTTARDLKLEAFAFRMGSREGDALQTDDPRCKSSRHSIACSFGDLEPEQSVSVVFKNWQQDEIRGHGGNIEPASWQYSHADGHGVLYRTQPRAALSTGRHHPRA
ncbi:hypothetical protein [Streptomyces sp. NPDC049949]|uniref:hypothetical protein n=1 Tax=Streptomyces sp. NPDC049949 TaxID=3154627 RepID=UPI003420BFA1